MRFESPLCRYHKAALLLLTGSKLWRDREEGGSEVRMVKE